MWVCSKGHLSSDKDYCSFCGSKIPTDLIVGYNMCNQCGAYMPENVNQCPVCSNVAQSTQTTHLENTDKIAENNTLNANYIKGTTVNKEDLGFEFPHNKEGSCLKLTISLDRKKAANVAQEYQAKIKDFSEFEVPLTFKSYLIGRESSSKGIYPEIPLTDFGLSQKHCEINLTKDGYCITDLGSTNGTLLNKKELAPHEIFILKPNDIIEIGAVTKIVVTEV